MAYTPNAFDFTRPVDTDIAETAQLEFRTMKAFYMGTVARTFQIVGAAVGGGVNMWVASIPAGILGTSRTLVMRATGFINNTTGGAANTNFLITYGGGGVNGTAIIPGNGTFAFELIFEVSNNNATNVQTFWLNCIVYGTNSGSGNQQSAAGNTGARNAGAVDSTIAQNLTINATNSSATNYNIVIDKAVITWE